MIKPKEFYNIICDNGIDFYTGVPDSLLKGFCNYIQNNVAEEKHIIAANEGNAISIASGYYLASGKPALVYMQNSGFGNCVNPLLSLVDKEVYSIPMLLLIGWRGEPNIKDEPQHIKQGKITIDLLKTMDIKHSIISHDSKDLKEIINNSIKYINTNNAPFALVVKKNTFAKNNIENFSPNKYSLKREDVVKIILDYEQENDIYVSTTGKLSRELFEYRVEKKQNHNKDFLTVGSMGHANQIAVGIAKVKTKNRIVCIDGDGALLMHMGGMCLVGSLGMKNYLHIVINNGAHDSVGGQPTLGFDINFTKIAKASNYKHIFSVENKKQIISSFKKIKNLSGPIFLEVKVSKGSRKNLGRPTISPQKNKLNFMKFLKNESKN
tara:strand:- start:102 stop:1241 length:1140 start_codon:yes stop_codon:yes gene_type:complete